MNLNQLGTMALIIVLAAVVITVGAAILDELAEDRCEQAGGTYVGGNCGVSATGGVAANNITQTAYNATQGGLEGMATFGDWLPLISLVVVASIVIGIIITYMGQR